MSWGVYSQLTFRWRRNMISFTFTSLLRNFKTYRRLHCLPCLINMRRDGYHLPSILREDRWTRRGDQVGRATAQSWFSEIVFFILHSRPKWLYSALWKFLAKSEGICEPYSLWMLTMEQYRMSTYTMEAYWNASAPLGLRPSTTSNANENKTARILLF